MINSRFELTEVELKKVNVFLKTLIKLSNSKLYDSMKMIIDEYTLSAKEYYTLLDELFRTNFNNDSEMVKIIFSSRMQYLNNDYYILGEPLASAILYQCNQLYKNSCDIFTPELVTELFLNKNTKIRFDRENINFDNSLQVLIDCSNKFTDEQFEKIADFLINVKNISVVHKNDFNKNAIELFLYRKRTNENVFKFLNTKYAKDVKDSYLLRLHRHCDEFIIEKAKRENKNLSREERIKERETFFINFKE